jgi:hypothetical protein
MYRKAIVALCFLSLTSCVMHAQNAVVEPLRVAAGTILTFHIQTRLHPDSDDEMDRLPQGTVLRVRLLSPIDSSVDRDGTEIRGVIASSVLSGDKVIVRADSEVRGLLALLRSKDHPEGFRYELLITSLMDHGKSYNLTAALNSLFTDGSSQSATPAKSAIK